MVLARTGRLIILPEAAADGEEGSGDITATAHPPLHHLSDGPPPHASRTGRIFASSSAPCTPHLWLGADHAAHSGPDKRHLEQAVLSFLSATRHPAAGD